MFVIRLVRIKFFWFQRESLGKKAEQMDVLYTVYGENKVAMHISLG